MMDIAIFLLNNTVSYSKESSVDKPELFTTLLMNVAESHIVTVF